MMAFSPAGVWSAVTVTASRPAPAAPCGSVRLAARPRSAPGASAPSPAASPMAASYSTAPVSRLTTRTRSCQATGVAALPSLRVSQAMASGPPLCTSSVVTRRFTTRSSGAEVSVTAAALFVSPVPAAFASNTALPKSASTVKTKRPVLVLPAGQVTARLRARVPPASRPDSPRVPV